MPRLTEHGTSCGGTIEIWTCACSWRRSRAWHSGSSSSMLARWFRSSKAFVSFDADISCADGDSNKVEGTFRLVCLVFVQNGGQPYRPEGLDLAFSSCGKVPTKYRSYALCLIKDAKIILPQVWSQDAHTQCSIAAIGANAQRMCDLDLDNMLLNCLN
eukprot:TRINITY_DN24455_c0_g2_i1.p2 TRINITY_DN24455_c0_g2~~TRINITY_DN24455_c0_g2_i1.p2  ORF type:complete len:158 (+),score=14.74 TRINITY_DN24455_c0_g2_i1:404-877(+)